MFLSKVIDTSKTLFFTNNRVPSNTMIRKENDIIAWYWAQDSRKDIIKRSIGDVFRYNDSGNEYYVAVVPFNGCMNNFVPKMSYILTGAALITISDFRAYGYNGNMNRFKF
eukprot:309031_1